MFDMWTVDQLERTLVEAEQRIGRLRAMQMALLDELDGAQVARLDGSRNLPEWVAARSDIDVESARRLVRTARTTSDRPELQVPLAEGEQSFARCEVTAHLAATGAGHDMIERSAGHDIAGVRRLASRHRRFTPVDEQQAFQRRHLVMQTSLDQAMGRLYGEFTGYDWRIIQKAITARADSFPQNTEAEHTTATQRRADALAAICHDTLDESSAGNTGPSRTPLITVIVDTRTQTSNPDLIDATILNGPRVGIGGTLERILCEGNVEAIGVDEHDMPRALGTTTRVIPPQLRRSILHRDGGCTSTAVAPATASNPTTSSPPPKAAPPTPTTSPPCAGTTTTSSSTAAATASTHSRHPTAADSSNHWPAEHHRARAAAGAANSTYLSQSQRIASPTVGRRFGASDAWSTQRTANESSRRSICRASGG